MLNSTNWLNQTFFVAFFETPLTWVGDLMRWNSILLCYSRTNDKHSTRMHGKNYLRVVENLTADLRRYMKFSELHLNGNVLEALDAMRFEECTPIQEKSIPVILEGRDLIAVAQTGTGKQPHICCLYWTSFQRADTLPMPSIALSWLLPASWRNR